MEGMTIFRLARKLLSQPDSAYHRVEGLMNKTRRLESNGRQSSFAAAPRLWPPGQMWILVWSVAGPAAT